MNRRTKYRGCGQIIIVLSALWVGITVAADGGAAANEARDAQPLAISCKDPAPVALDAYAVAYEVNGVSYCGASAIIWQPWKISVPYGQKVKIRYALINSMYGVYSCSTGVPMFLYLQAPAMGISSHYRAGSSGWVSAGGTYVDYGYVGAFVGKPKAYWQVTPARNVWNALYEDYPPRGSYVLAIGCDTDWKYGEIRFTVY